MVDYITNLPFFQTLAFGIIAMITVGSSWCLVGLVMGDAPKKNIDPALVQFFGAVVALIACLIIMFCTTGIPQASFKVAFLTCGAYFTGSVLNFFMLQLMSAAMQKGPNGIIWAIIQSALIFPFIGGVVFFDVKLNLARLCGILLLLAALIFFSMAKDNSRKGGNSWKYLAFIALGITAIQQNLHTAPSYFEEARVIPSIVRALFSTAGTLAGAVGYTLFQLLRKPEFKEMLMTGMKNPVLWKYVAVLQFFNLLFAYTLFYPGMNVMADAGLGGMCYPMMVGSCIVSFMLTSMLLLKEKLRGVQILALILCISGLVFLCFPE